MEPSEKRPFTGSEDEDLFDFPDMTVFEPLPTGDQPAEAATETPSTEAPTPEAPPSPPPTVETPAPIAEPTPEPVVAEAPAPPPPPPPAAAPQAVGTDSGPLDADLDEDLFNFDTIFLDEDADVASPAEEPVAPTAVDDPLPTEDLSPLPPAPTFVSEEPAPEPPPVPAPSAPAPAAAATAPAATQATITPVAQPKDEAPEPAKKKGLFRKNKASKDDAPAAPVSVSVARASVPVTAGAPPNAAEFQEGRRSRLVELLAVGFLIGNVALILFAWRAGDDFRETLVHVTGAITEAVQDGQAQASTRTEPRALPTPVELPQAPTPDPVAEPEVLEGPVAPIDRGYDSLGLAKDKLEVGEYAAARRALFRLLANQDRGVLPPEVTAEAEILIARSYSLQGQALREGVQ